MIAMEVNDDVETRAQIRTETLPANRAIFRPFSRWRAPDFAALRAYMQLKRKSRPCPLSNDRRAARPIEPPDPSRRNRSCTYRNRSGPERSE